VEKSKETRGEARRRCKGAVQPGRIPNSSSVRRGREGRGERRDGRACSIVSRSEAILRDVRAGADEMKEDSESGREREEIRRDVRGVGSIRLSREARRGIARGD